VNARMLALVVIAAAACSSAPPRRGEGGEKGGGIPDAALGLSKTSVFDVPAPPAIKANDSAPGEQPVVPRAYALAPPRIPHAIGDFLPITPKQNACADCHTVKEKEPGQPTPIPASHYTDFRNAPGKPGDKVVGARWVCTSCHVPLTDAKPLVGNAFRP
jgi:nitrate reductase (cytochrome), electron transfer subunit